jgi:hypothetical protein
LKLAATAILPPSLAGAVYFNYWAFQAQNVLPAYLYQNQSLEVVSYACVAVISAILIPMVLSVMGFRFCTNARNTYAGLESDPMKICINVLNNSYEQLLIFVLSILALGTYEG